MIDINAFVRSLCGLLGIDHPQILPTDSMPSETMLAGFVTADNTIYIKRNAMNNLDLYFAVAHELRHAWQYITDADGFFDGYRTRSECESTEQYNIQRAELDANAFAVVVMVDAFGVLPKFSGLPDYLRERIYSIAELIRQDL